MGAMAENQAFRHLHSQRSALLHGDFNFYGHQTASVCQIVLGKESGIVLSSYKS